MLAIVQRPSELRFAPVGSALKVRRAAVVAAPVLAALLIVAGFFLDPATGKSGSEMRRSRVRCTPWA